MANMKCILVSNQNGAICRLMEKVALTAQPNDIIIDKGVEYRVLNKKMNFTDSTCELIVETVMPTKQAPKDVLISILESAEVKMWLHKSAHAGQVDALPENIYYLKGYAATYYRLQDIAFAYHYTIVQKMLGAIRIEHAIQTDLTEV